MHSSCGDFFGIGRMSLFMELPLLMVVVGCKSSFILLVNPLPLGSIDSSASSFVDHFCMSNCSSSYHSFSDSIFFNILVVDIHHFYSTAHLSDLCLTQLFLHFVFLIAATLQLFVHFVASVFAGVIQDMFGRRRCLFISLIPQISSWLVLYFAKDVLWLFVHAVLVGLSTALSEQTIVTYIGEVSTVKLRGRLFSISKLGYGFGSFYAFFCSSISNSFRTLAVISCILPLFVLILILWVS